MNQQATAMLHIRFEKPSTATYDCYRCGQTEGPVTGRYRVVAFAERVRQVHAGRCTPIT